MDSKNGIKEILDMLADLSEDNSVPKNVRLKVKDIITTLSCDEEVSLKVNKALHKLDEISDDINLNTYARTQIWDITSKLEGL